MDPIQITREIVQSILQAKKSKSAKAVAYLNAVAIACHELASLKDIDTDAAILAHERLKQIYLDASKSFPHNSNPHGSFVLLNALSAARIYYWVRKWESLPDARLELRVLIDFREDLYGSSSADTLARAVSSLLDGNQGSAMKYRDALGVIKRNSLRDIAKLDSFVLECGSN